MTLQFEITKAMPEDAAAIFEMAKELAQMQDLLSRFCITETVLGDMLNESNPATMTIKVISGQEIIGFAMFTLLKNNRLYHDGFAMYIDELYVKSEYRGHGIGTHLFKYIANQAVIFKCNRMEWWVERSNTGASTFYNTLGARALDEFMTYRLQSPALEAFINQ